MSVASQSEHRRHPRVRHTMPLTLSSVRLFVLAGPTHDADMVDISRGGVRIRTHALLESGKQVILRLRSRALRRILHYRGTVVWSRVSRESSGAPHTAGIRFAQHGEDERMMVYRLVTGNGAA